MMPTMRLHRSLTALLCAAALTACEKNAVQEIAAPAPTTAIRFFNFAVNAPHMNFYAGDLKITATLSALCPITSTDQRCTTTGVEQTTGIQFGSVGANGLYTGIEPGQYTVNGRLVAAGADRGTKVVNTQVTIASGKLYSFYASGFYNTATKTADGFIVEDNFPAEFDWSRAYVRFVNGISNSQPMTLYAVNTENAQEIAIGGTVAYKSGGAFVAVPVGSYDLRTRLDGSTTNAIVRTGVPFQPGRVYTITSRGDMTVVSTTATNRPFLDNTLNR